MTQPKIIKSRYTCGTCNGHGTRKAEGTLVTVMCEHCGGKGNVEKITVSSDPLNPFLEQQLENQREALRLQNAQRAQKIGAMIFAILATIIGACTLGIGVIYDSTLFTMAGLVTVILASVMYLGSA